MSKSLLPALIGGAAILGSGGLATPAVGAGAAGGTAAMGAGAAAGNALAAQGAAGLLGTAGAAAAGYGAPAALGGSALGVGAAGNTGIDAATASFGPNGEYTGNTIASELSANPYTGGYDSLNGLERVGQRVGGFFEDGGLDKVNKFKGLFGGQEQPQEQPKDKVISGGAVQGGQEPSQMGAPVYGQGIQYTPEQLAMLKQRMMMQRGYLNG